MSVSTALDRATYVHVIYRDRGRIVHDEVLCRRCFEELERAGAFTKPAHRRGRQTEVVAWHGEPRCAGCEAAS